MSKRRKHRRVDAQNRSARQDGNQRPVQNSLMLFGMPVPYWQVSIAAIALIVAIAGSPWLINYYNKSQATANISYDILVQPDIVLGNDGKARDDTWLAAISTRNDGPATAENFVMHLKLSANLIDYSRSQPTVANQPPGTDIDIAYAGGGSTYLISAKNLAPKTGFIIVINFVVSDRIKDEVQQHWESEMFSGEFIGQFIRYLWTSGENVNATIGGVLSPTPVAEWYAP